MEEINIPESNENGDVSIGCLCCVRNIWRRIQEFSFSELFICTPWQYFFCLIRLLVIILGSVAIGYHDEFKEGTKQMIIAYCAAAVACALVSFAPRGGHLMKHSTYGIRKLQTQPEVKSNEGMPKVKKSVNVTTWYSDELAMIIYRCIVQKQGELGIKEKVSQHDLAEAIASGRPFPGKVFCDVYSPESKGIPLQLCMDVMDVEADVHRAEEPSESSTSADLVSGSSDDPLLQPGPSGLGNLPQSSTDPSSRSTSSTPLEYNPNEQLTENEGQK